MSKVMYGHDVPTLEANKLAHEARANGWTSLSWIAQNGDMWRLFGVPPEWLKEGDVVAFSTGKYAADWLQIQTKALYRAMADGWTGLRWVDDKDQGLFHLVGKRPADDRGHIALPIGDVPMLEAVQREHGMDGLRKREAKRSPDEPKSIDLARAWVMDAFNEWARNTHCTRREWDVICEDIRAALWGRAPKEAPPEPEQVTAPSDGPPRIRSELGGLMGPGYQATGYEPPPRRRVLLDDPTGDDIAGDVLP